MCVCSEAEAFCLVTVVSILSGTLVIGSDSGVTRELISDGENGLFYKKGNERDLADKIQRAVLNPLEARQISFRDQKNALEMFSLEHNINSIVELYNEIVLS